MPKSCVSNASYLFADGNYWLRVHLLGHAPATLFHFLLLHSRILCALAVGQTQLQRAFFLP
jgi:hypothetical protein